MGIEQIKGEAQSIIKHMSNNNLLKHVVSTSDAFGGNRQLHRNFLRVANVLRKKGYSVKPNIQWNVTDWEIKH